MCLVIQQSLAYHKEGARVGNKKMISRENLINENTLNVEVKIYDSIAIKDFICKSLFVHEYFLVMETNRPNK